MGKYLDKEGVKKVWNKGKSYTDESVKKYLPLTGGTMSNTNLVGKLNAEYLNGRSITNLSDGVYVVYLNSSNANYISVCNCDEFKKRNTTNPLTPVGILVKDSNEELIVALDELQCGFSSDRGDFGGFTTTNYTKAMLDMRGRLNTAFEYTHPECQTLKSAVGYCVNYDRIENLKGRWWLPSLGELELLRANCGKINYALSVVGGTKFNGVYWSSTEASADRVWYTTLQDNLGISTYNDTRKNSEYESPSSSCPKARPVIRLQNKFDYGINSVSPFTFETIDTNNPTLPSIDFLPPIANVSTIILRYNGVVKDLDTYANSAPITLSALQNEGLIEDSVTNEDLVDLGILDKEEVEDGNVDIPRDKLPILTDIINDNRQRLYGSEVMPMINLDDYIGTPNSWLKIFVPVAYIQDYKDTYQYLANHFFPIQGDINQNSEIGGTNLIVGSKTFSYPDCYKAGEWNLLDETYRGGNILSAVINSSNIGQYRRVAFRGIFEPNTTYTFSFYARGNIAFYIFPCYRNAKVILYDSNGKKYSDSTTKNWQISFGVTEKFKKYVVCFTTNNTDSAYDDGDRPVKWSEIGAQIRTHTITNENSYFEIACPKIEYGTVPTAWSLAPEDFLTVESEWYGTQSEYDALGTYNENTKYYILED